MLPTFSMSDSAPTYPTIEDVIGETPLVRLVRLPRRRQRRARQRHPGQARGQQSGRLGQGPAGDQSMIRRAEERGEIKPGDTLIEATSGNTGIALAMAAAIRGYRMLLVMPEDLSRRARADDEGVRRRARCSRRKLGRHGIRARPGRRRCSRTARAACSTSSPTPTTRASTTRRPARRSGSDTDGRITHFVSAMGTTGTITGVSRYLKEKNPAVRIIGAQPSEGSRIPGHPQVAAGIPAEDLRPDARRRAGAGQPGRRRGDVRGGWRARRASSPASRRPAPAGSRCRSPQQRRERDDRVRRLRPRRPLSVDRRLSRPERAAGDAARVPLLPELRDARCSWIARWKTAARRRACAARPAAGRTGTTRRRCSPR